MVNLKAYQKYKNPNIIYLDSVPIHWSIYKIRQICELIVSNVDKITLLSD